MLEHTMPGEALLSNGVPAEHHLKLLQQQQQAAAKNGPNNKTLQEMADKLEKSEAGRKKLRQAISMLKEKVEANEKVLQVNEILRQECEKERLRAEAEWNRAEEEKSLREQVEKEGLSTKEQLVRVLQRLDAVERSCKADHNEIERTRKEMRQATLGLGGAVKAIEAAHSSFEGLEKDLLGKVAVKAIEAAHSSFESLQKDLLGKVAVKAIEAAHSYFESLEKDILGKAAVKATEAAHSSFEILEKNLLIKVSNAVCTSTKSTSLAIAEKEKIPDSLRSGTKIGRNEHTREKLPVALFNDSNAVCGSTKSTSLAETAIVEKEKISDSLRNGTEIGRNGHTSAKLPDAAPKNCIAVCASTKCTSLAGAVAAEKENISDSHKSGTKIGGNRYKRKEVPVALPEDCNAVCASTKSTSLAETAIAEKGKISDSLEKWTKIGRNGHTSEKLPIAALKDIIPVCASSKCTSLAEAATVEKEKKSHSPKTKIGRCGHTSEKLPVAALKDSIPVCASSKCTSLAEAATAEKEKISHSPKRGTKIGRNGHKREEVALPKDSTAVGACAKSTSLVEAPTVEKEKISDSPKCGTKIGRNGHKREEVALRKGGNEIGTCTKSTSLAKTAITVKEKISDSPKSGTKTGRNGHKTEKLPVALLQDITKLFRKEKQSHERMERKLAALQKVLQNSENYEYLKEGSIDSTLENSRKRKRRESLKEYSHRRPRIRGLEQTHTFRSKEDRSFSTHDQWVGGVDARRAVEVGACNRKSNVAMKEDSTNHLQPPANKAGHSDPSGYGKDLSEGGWIGPEIMTDSVGPEFPMIGPAPLVLESLGAAPIVIEPRQEMDINTEEVTGRGWESDSETSEDEMGEDWWTQERILLSPSLPIIHPPSLALGGSDSNAPLPWSAASYMNLEDISLFLDVLPPIDQVILDNGKAVGTLPDMAASKSEELYIESGVTTLDGQRSKELQRGLYSDLRECTERSLSHTLVQCLESESKSSENVASCVENILSSGASCCGNSISLATRPVVGKSEVQNDRLIVDSGARRDDVLRDSKGAVKEEIADGAQYAASECVESFFPYSLELVAGGLAQERGHSTGTTMRQGSLGSTTDFSNKIREAYGRTQEVMQRALHDKNHDVYGSSLAIASEIASFFVSSTLSKSDLMCILIASLVDSHASWENENSSSFVVSDCKSLRLLIDIEKQVLATEVFENSLSSDQVFLLLAVQLQKFLIQGIIKPVRPKESGEALNEGCVIEQCFHFATPSSKLKRLEALTSGGKLLAFLCKTNGKLDFLLDSFYRVLRFCDMDNECLLSIISSLACVGYVRLSEVDKDDVVGQAVRVVISELIHDVEVGRPGEFSSARKVEIECQMEMQQGSLKAAEGNSDCILLLQSLRALREIIGEEEDLKFEDFVPRLVELFKEVISATPGSQLIGKRHLFQRSLRMITCNQIKPKSAIDANSLVQSEQSVNPCTSNDVPEAQIGEKDADRSPVEDYCWRDVTVKSSIQPVSQPARDANFTEEWEQKFYDITNALELVASHLGWEWTYNDFIVEHLWKLVSPGAPSMTVACVAHMFGLLGRLGREVDSTELPGVDELRKSLLVVLSLDQASPILSGGPLHNFSFNAQVAAAQALLALSSSNRKDEDVPIKGPERFFSKSSELHAKSVKSLWNWVQALKPEIQQILPYSLRCALLSIDSNNFVPIF